MLELAHPPVASKVEELPGFTPYTRRRSLSPSQSRKWILILLLLIALPCAEGCLPSWFRNQKNKAEPLEGTIPVVDNNSETTVTHKIPESTLPEQIPGIPLEEPIPVNYDDESDLDDLYGTAKPIVIDPRLEKARIYFKEIECPGYCIKGTCEVHVDEHTYELVSTQCRCPPDYYGQRCDKIYVRHLFAPVKAGTQVENTAAPAFIFLFIVCSVCIAFAIFICRRFSKKESKWDTASMTSRSMHGAVSNGTTTIVRRPFTTRKTPVTSTRAPLLNPRGRIILPSTPITHGIVNETDYSSNYRQETTNRSRPIPRLPPLHESNNESSPNYTDHIHAHDMPFIDSHEPDKKSQPSFDENAITNL